jgi:hypothetical protein
MLFAAAAVVAVGAAAPGEVAAEALVAMIRGAPIPMDSATTDAVISRALGSLMCLPLSVFSSGHDVRQLPRGASSNCFTHIYPSFHDHLLAILCVFPQVAGWNGRRQTSFKKKFSPRTDEGVRAPRLARGFGHRPAQAEGLALDG